MSTSPDKTPKICPHAKKCGGCQMLNLSYPEHLASKQSRVKRLLRPFCPVRPIIGVEDPYHYRAKVQASL